MFSAYQFDIKVTLPMPELHWWNFGGGVALSMNIEAYVQHLPN